MSTLREYLVQKREALLARREKSASGPVEPLTLEARVTAEGRSGVRRIRIREHRIISDSGPDFAGYDLGPGSPEIQVGVLGSCVTHIYLIKAADFQIPLDSLEVHVTGVVDPRGTQDEFPEIPVEPHNITYRVHISSPASDEELERLKAAVEKDCPILNLLRNPQTVTGEIVRAA